MGRLSILGNLGHKNGKKVPFWHEKKGLYEGSTLDIEGGQKTLVQAPARVFYLLVSGRNPLIDFSWY